MKPSNVSKKRASDKPAHSSHGLKRQRIANRKTLFSPQNQKSRQPTSPTVHDSDGKSLSNVDANGSTQSQSTRAISISSESSSCESIPARLPGSSSHPGYRPARRPILEPKFSTLRREVRPKEDEIPDSVLISQTDQIHHRNLLILDEAGAISVSSDDADSTADDGENDEAEDSESDGKISKTKSSPLQTSLDKQSTSKKKPNRGLSPEVEMLPRTHEGQRSQLKPRAHNRLKRRPDLVPTLDHVPEDPISLGPDSDDPKRGSAYHSSSSSSSASSSPSHQNGEPDPVPLLTVDGRSYRQVIGHDGKVVNGCGALFPRGYTIMPQHSPNVWICPVRSCRVLLKTAQGLGGHFNAAHREMLLNDNGDGTFSEIGKRRVPDANGRSPACVVSTEPLNPNDSAMAAPRMPGSHSKKESPNATGKLQDVVFPEGEDEGVEKGDENEDDEDQGDNFGEREEEDSIPKQHTASSSDESRSDDQASTLAKQIAPRSGSPEQVDQPLPTIWSYVHQYLALGAKKPPQSYYAPFLEATRQRDLSPEWCNRLKSLGSGVTSTTTFTAVLIYLAGSRVACSNCNNPRGLEFDECIAVLSSDSAMLSKLFRSCCNCILKGSSGPPCAFVRRHVVENTGKGDNPNTADQRVSSVPKNQAGGSNQRVLENGGQSTRLQELRKSETPSSSSRTDSTTTSSSGSSPVTAAPRLSSSFASTSRASPGEAASSSASISGASHIPAVVRESPSSVSTPGAAAQQVDLLNNLPPSISHTGMHEAEDWEFAPGRIRANTGEGPENIAFSAAYLAQNQRVSISDGVGIQVITIKCSTHHFQPEGSTVRVCFVSAGKLKVKLLGQEFMMGPGGCFTISKGVAATVENKFYVDAVLQVTSIQE